MPWWGYNRLDLATEMAWTRARILLFEIGHDNYCVMHRLTYCLIQGRILEWRFANH